MDRLWAKEAIKIKVKKSLFGKFENSFSENVLNFFVADDKTGNIILDSKIENGANG